MLVLKHFGPTAVHNLTAYRGTAPVVMLCVPNEGGVNSGLERAYMLIIEGLSAIAKGAALDVSQN